MDCTHCTNYKGVDIVIHVTDMDYNPYRPATGPSYSCAGEPPEPEEAYATAGWLEIDGDVNDMGPLSSEEMDVIVSITNDPEELFDAVCEECEEELFDTLIQYVEDQREEYAVAKAEAAGRLYKDEYAALDITIFD